MNDRPKMTSEDDMSIVSLHDCLVLGFGGIMDDGQGVLPGPIVCDDDRR